MSLLKASQLGDMVKLCCLLLSQQRHKRFPALPRLTTRLPHQLIQLHVTLLSGLSIPQEYSAVFKMQYFEMLLTARTEYYLTKKLQHYLEVTTTFPKDKIKTQALLQVPLVYSHFFFPYRNKHLAKKLQIIVITIL